MKTCFLLRDVAGGGGGGGVGGGERETEEGMGLNKYNSRAKP